MSVKNNTAPSIIEILNPTEYVRSIPHTNSTRDRRPKSRLDAVLLDYYADHPDLVDDSDTPTIIEYRPAEVRHLKKTLTERNRTLHTTEQALLTTKVLLAILGVYSVVVTIASIALGGVV